MNIFTYEFKTYIKSILIWSLSITGMLVLFMSIFPSMAADATLMDKILENYPEAMLKAFGMSDGLSLSSVLGYFAFIFAFVQLCLAIQSSYYGFHFLSVEERELTADFLMSKPVSRQQIITAKFLAAFASLQITNLFVWIGSFGSIMLFKDGHEFDLGNLIILLLSTILFQLFFLSVGMIITVLSKKIRSVLMFSMALSFGLYILNAVKGVIGGDILGIITPFYHFDAAYILEHNKYNIPMVSISVGIIVVSLVSSYFLYQKRNIHSL